MYLNLITLNIYKKFWSLTPLLEILLQSYTVLAVTKTRK